MDKKNNKKTAAAYKKMTPEEVQGLLAFRRKGGKIPAKKGKGSYNRNNFKRGGNECFG